LQVAEIKKFRTVGYFRRSRSLDQDTALIARRQIGHQPRFTDALPRTRSGKIMRRLLGDISAGVETVGDTSTIEVYSALASVLDWKPDASG
jgi:acetyl-CoA synthetase